ncbi:MAG: electron transfer flavoprotein subunit alpha/FixB family protein [Kiritimatiellae bacterium]|nr:electron transfer flavoprotein subunit alpha/FixB family protein [Kiritimatiellia bacterium]
MSYIKVHQDKIADREAAKALCPFGAIAENAEGVLEIGAGCRMCRLCIRKGGGAFEFVDDSAPGVDKSKWRGVAVVTELLPDGDLHPVGLELLGKARELAAKIDHPVMAVVIGSGTDAVVDKVLAYGADEVHVYDDPALAHFRIEPYANALSDFIEAVHPSSVLVGGTVNGRSLAPRVAARFRTGLTADCTVLDMSPTTDLDQIRPAYGGNIMAHINTPRHRPQFATVRYKIFAMPKKGAPHGKVVRHALSADRLASLVEVLEARRKPVEKGIEEAEALVVCGRGVKKPEDVEMLRELAALLGGEVASTRAVVEAGWMDAKRQIGLSGRTVKPKLIVTCGVSGAIQFVAGMNNSETIVAINTDPKASIFKVAHVGVVGDLYTVVPELIARIKAKKEAK